MLDEYGDPVQLVPTSQFTGLVTLNGGESPESIEAELRAIVEQALEDAEKENGK